MNVFLASAAPFFRKIPVQKGAMPPNALMSKPASVDTLRFGKKQNPEQEMQFEQRLSHLNGLMKDAMEKNIDNMVLEDDNDVDYMAVVGVTLEGNKYTYKRRTADWYDVDDNESFKAKDVRTLSSPDGHEVIRMIMHDKTYDIEYQTPQCDLSYKRQKYQFPVSDFKSLTIPQKARILLDKMERKYENDHMAVRYPAGMRFI